MEANELSVFGDLSSFTLRNGCDCAEAGHSWKWGHLRNKDKDKLWPRDFEFGELGGHQKSNWVSGFQVHCLTLMKKKDLCGRMKVSAGLSQKNSSNMRSNGSERLLGVEGFPREENRLSRWLRVLIQRLRRSLWDWLILWTYCKLK